MKIDGTAKIKEVLRGIKDYFFPKNCLNCHAEGAWLCESCKNSLFFIDARFCPYCRKVAPLFCLCDGCKKATGISKVFILFTYKDLLVRKIIKNFKYRYLRDMADELEPLLRKFIFKYKSLLEFGEGAVIVPVPLYWYKERERGFNQAGEIARVIGKILTISVDDGLITKGKITKNQADLEIEERFDNLQAAFKVSRPPPKNIILVDDVFTTGSTIKEIARVLKAAGAENIRAIALARGVDNLDRTNR